MHTQLSPRKLFAVLLVTLCSLTAAGRINTVSAARLPVFVSILPQAYFVERIGGERVKVDVLVQPGQSPATYSPTPKQMVKLAEARIFFRIGVPFEKVFLPKIEDALPDLLVVDTSQGIALQTLDHHDHGEEHPDEGQEGTELDPHIWLDPMLVKKLAGIIKETLIRVDPQGTELYEKNYASLAGELDELDRELKDTLAPLKGKTLLVFHPSYGYFARAYGLHQLAVETGGKQPSARQLAHIIETAREKEVRIIFVQPQFSEKSARTVARAINGTVVALDPLARDYLANMRHIARSVKKALP